MVVLTQSDEGRLLRVVGCLYCMMKRQRAGSYVYDCPGVKQLRLPSHESDIGALLLALTRVGSRVLSLKGRRCDWNDSNECMSLLLLFCPCCSSRPGVPGVKDGVMYCCVRGV